MSKEYLEALERLYKCNVDDYTLGYQRRDYKLLQETLQRLEAIDNANPSEALECLKEIHSFIVSSRINGEKFEQKLQELATINQALLKAQEQDFNYNKIVIPFFDELAKLLGINDTDEMLDKIKEQEKENAELKRVLSVIKEKSDLSALEMADDVNEFNEMTFHKKPYTQEEFDLVKRYFK